MEIIRLEVAPIQINLFSQFYMLDKENDYNSLNNTLIAWRAGQYQVYLCLDGGNIMGIGHGWCRGPDFFGHMYWIKKYRGREALEGLKKMCDFIMKDFDIKRITSVAPDDRPEVKVFLRAAGFKKIGKRYEYAT